MMKKTIKAHGKNKSTFGKDRLKASQEQENKLNWHMPEIIKVPEKHVSCDGGGGVLGHPKVWLEMGEENWVECPYCDRRFILEGV